MSPVSFLVWIYLFYRHDSINLKFDADTNAGADTRPTTSYTNKADSFM